MRKTIKENSLYLVTGEDCSKGRTTLEVAEAAIKAGIDMIQMREKEKSYEQLVSLGNNLSKLTKEKDVIFIVNDHPEIAKEIDADGVHLGQEDKEEITIDKTREIIGQDKLIGLSTHSLEQVKESNKLDVDYIGYGPIFPTKTKNYSIGTKDINKVLEISTKPVIFIGGINLNNIDIALVQGAKNIAMIREITQAENIEKRVKEIKERMKKGSE